MVKPILKWVGGKTQLLNKLMTNFPERMHNYHEIFLGGGSVLLAFLERVLIDKTIEMTGMVYAYDLNEPLIYMYRNIQDFPEELYVEVCLINDKFNECGEGGLNRKPTNIDEAKACKENYYYWIRSEYNGMNVEGRNSLVGSAMFIFMNKTCFRGVFRVGPNGFNVPYGHNKSPEIINKKNLMEVHALIRDVRFIHCDFRDSIGCIGDTDFAYLDPPYAPSEEKSFVGYTENGFDIKNHMDLFGMLTNMKECGGFIMSNADVKLVRDNFSEDRYIIESVSARRAINSKNPGAKAMEVIITSKR
jgi:DNA adenine methylase